MSTQKADISVCSSSSERTSSRLSKRFRPSVRCHHTDKNTENQCSADGFMECVHCDEICCLQHITEHQNELKQLRDQLVQEASEVFLKLTEMQVTDTREELQENLGLWKQRMFKHIERTYQKLLEDIEQSFVNVNAEFESKKENLGKEFDQEISAKLERLASKNDFYPHELDELKLSLEEMTNHMRQARTSMVQIDFGHQRTSLIDDEGQFERPKVIIQSKPDLERILHGSYLRQFYLEIDNHPHSLLYDTSSKQLLVYNNEGQSLELFDHDERIGVGLWSMSSPITCLKWSSYLNAFLLLCSQSLHSLNCSEQPLAVSLIEQVTPPEGLPMKHLCLDRDWMLIKHGNGSFIDHYSLKTFDLLKRWSKKDFYAYEQTSVEIHRMELYSNVYLAMNVELNEDIDVLDLFLLPHLQHVRRVDNAYLILYLPLTNYWIIKMKNNEENEPLHFSLLDHQGELTRLHLDQPEKIHDLHLFGSHCLLVLRANTQTMQIQLFPIDHPL